MPRRKQKSLTPVYFVIGGGLILIIAAILLATQNQPSTGVPTTASIESVAEIPRVKLDEAKAAFDAREAIIVDVRGADVYAMEHIAGAKSIPLSEIEERLDELDPKDWIITYCT